MNTIQSRISLFHPWMIIIILSFLLRMGTLGFGNLLVEEAYYWNYAQHLDFGYLDHPPMVAWLIKAFTHLFKITEWSVRIPAFLCWVIAAFFSFRLTELIFKRGWYAVFLISILPFFFLQSWVMTPDQPLVAAWSAALYYLYRACVLNQASAWYYAGIALGLGLLSKYTIALLIPSVGVYLMISTDKYIWFFKKETYLALLIALLLFSPVIYWNACHDWSSFVFQTSRRLQGVFQFSTFHLLGWVLVFLLPFGVLALWTLFKSSKNVMGEETRRFFLALIYFPLCVFIIFSFMHPIRFNWIGPIFLMLIPWLAWELKYHPKAWLLSACALLITYSSMMFVISTGTPVVIHRWFFNKVISWQHLSQYVLQEAKNVEKETHEKPILVALDKYHIASELAFYQAKQNSSDNYSILGSDLFGGESLMYRFWGTNIHPSGKTLLLITDDPSYFNNQQIHQYTKVESSILSWNVPSVGRIGPIKKFFCLRVRMA